MKNVFHIIRTDARRICSSVVAIVIIMGLCVVPCLYAWFNIFSNWDPYGTDATSRIRVAVVSLDRGADLFGVELNVGDQMISALEANTQIGWVFAESRDEALGRVYSGDCYAALVVPTNFSRDFVSFLSLKFKHPQILYYENGKKNAIAPKITGQAKNSVQNQINATFLQTVVSSAAEVVAVMKANGIDISGTLQNLSDKIEELSEKLDDSNATLDSLANLANASKNLLYASGTLVGDVSLSIGVSETLAESMRDNMAANASSIRQNVEAINTALEASADNMSTLYNDLNGMLQDEGSLFNLVEQDLESRRELATVLRDNSYQMSQICSDMGLNAMAWQMELASRDFGNIVDRLDTLLDSDPEEPGSLESRRNQMLDTLSDLDSARSALNAAAREGSNVLGASLADTLNSTSATMNEIGQLLAEVQGAISNIANELYAISGTMGTLESSVYNAKTAIAKARAELKKLSDFLDALSESEFLNEIMDLLENGPDVLDAHIASPIRVSEEILFPVDSYGSQMAPFYTVLAQWVGALFCAVLLKPGIHKKDRPKRLTVPQHFFGRYGIYFFVGVAQALITSLGDLWYVGILCAHPGLFVLAAVMTSLCFTMINYMFVFCLGSAGLGVSVIVMVLQVGGAGGTYPVEVLPAPFRLIYPYMPFKFAMNAMREAVSGLYGNNYWWNIKILALIILGCIVLSFLLYIPGQWLNRMLSKSTDKTGIMSF